MQNIRYSDRYLVDWKQKGDIEGKVISPMLFLNFVENAFKYASKRGEKKAEIVILLQVDNGVLTFSCINDCEQEMEQRNKLGTGIANAKRRLELIYPGRHQIDIERSDEKFSVNLVIQLYED